MHVIVERAKEEDKEWSYYDNWKKENKNTNRAMSNRCVPVCGGYLRSLFLLLLFHYRDYNSKFTCVRFVFCFPSFTYYYLTLIKCSIHLIIVNF